MKKAIVVMCFLCAMYATYAQQARPASGGEAIGSGGSASYTIGQVYYTKNVSETQGIQQASTTTWTGGGISNAWSLAQNWSFAVPDADSEVIINSGSANYPTASASVVVKSVAMASGSTLIASNDFSGNITYKRHISSTNWHLISSPVLGQDIDVFASTQSLASGKGNNRGLSAYDNSIPAWIYWQAGTSNSGDFMLGAGKTIKLTQPANLTFTGAISTADVPINITSYENGFNLIGNPYPSYIAVNPNVHTSSNLLTLNGIDGLLTEETLWIWNQSLNGGEYIPKNLASPAFYIAPGQGFFVKANGDHTFRFTEGMQTHMATDTFLKETITRPEIILSASNGAMVKNTDIYYIEGTTTGWDNGYDSTMSAIGNNTFALYTHLLSGSGGQNLAIQSLPNTEFENMVIPLGVNATAETVLTISVAAINLPEGVSIYVEDKEAASYTLLSDSSNFTTTLSSSLNGIGRFYLHTTSNVLSVNPQISPQISMYTSSSHNLRIVGVQDGTGKVSIYNALGKQVLNTSFKATGIHNIALPSHLSNGVYIVQLITNTGIISKKISIH